jgi:hypothetical protein
LDTVAISKSFREKGKTSLKEANGAVVTLIKPEFWKEEFGKNWTYLLFDLFQIRSICSPFSEISLDLVEFATKPTVYTSPVNKSLASGPIDEGCIRFSLIREPNWNKLLFQMAHPVLFQIAHGSEFEFETNLYFPLLSPSRKELFLGPDGEIKIIKG